MTSLFHTHHPWCSSMATQCLKTYASFAAKKLDGMVTTVKMIKLISEEKQGLCYWSYTTVGNSILCRCEYCSIRAECCSYCGTRGRLQGAIFCCTIPQWLCLQPENITQLQNIAHEKGHGRIQSNCKKRKVVYHAINPCFALLCSFLGWHKADSAHNFLEPCLETGATSLHSRSWVTFPFLWTNTKLIA